ncbi:Uncharacterised protein [Mycobacterium tuberculosis]|nr:Uncharacterised protein [Mycobacterium tuberculosis]
MSGLPRVVGVYGGGRMGAGHRPRLPRLGRKTGEGFYTW